MKYVNQISNKKGKQKEKVGKITNFSFAQKKQKEKVGKITNFSFAQKEEKKREEKSEKNSKNVLTNVVCDSIIKNVSNKEKSTLKNK